MLHATCGFVHYFFAFGQVLELFCSLRPRYTIIILQELLDAMNAASTAAEQQNSSLAGGVASYIENGLACLRKVTALVYAVGVEAQRKDQWRCVWLQSSGKDCSKCLFHYAAPCKH